MELIGQTKFIAGTKEFIEDTKVAKMEIDGPNIKQEMEKKEQISIDHGKKEIRLNRRIV